ncbi:RHS repeat-associated core domain-containing protein, partial [Oleiagrimonas citrea]
FVTNAQGTVVAEMDNQGNTTYEAAYRPYGQQQSGAPQAEPGYTGHVNDPDTGLVYMQARYYDSEIGRFVSVDLVRPEPGNIFGVNDYVYANNTPVMKVDLNGMFCGGVGEVSAKVQVLRDTSDGCNGGQTKAYSYVSLAFRHYSPGADGILGAQSKFPSKTVSAVYKFTTSPVGKKIYDQAIKEGGKINLVLEPSGFPPTYHLQNGTNNTIVYSLDVAGFLRDRDKEGEMHGATLDIILGHEIGHTKIAVDALGYSQSEGYWQNEFNVVRNVENPYRAYIGAPLRTRYSGYPVPKPLLGGKK